MFVVEHETGTIRDAAGNVVVTSDSNGSIRDTSGKILLFGEEPFVKDICLGGHCFICGVSPDAAEFNGEHIIPQWVLDFTHQREGKIRLPNQTLFHNKYGGYTVPCCVKCNTGLSEAYEKVLSPLFKAGYKPLREHLLANGSTVLFRWLALLFLKTHLRDASLRLERDRRKKIDATIGDLYEWQALHHVHCIARSHYTGINFDTRQIGSLLILPAAAIGDTERFDYAANYFGRTVMIRVGEIVCFAVLNDASIVQTHFPRALKLPIDGAPLTPWQIRELHCQFTWRSWCLKTRPRFATIPIPQPHFETVMPPYVEFAPKPIALPDQEMTYGELLHHACLDYFEALPEEDRAAAEAKVLAGDATWFEDDVPHWPVSEPSSSVTTKKPRRQRAPTSRPQKAQGTKRGLRNPGKAASNDAVARAPVRSNASKAASKGVAKRRASPVRGASARPKRRGGKRS
jgi:hypothetical protein